MDDVRIEDRGLNVNPLEKPHCWQSFEVTLTGDGIMSDCRERIATIRGAAWHHRHVCCRSDSLGARRFSRVYEIFALAFFLVLAGHAWSAPKEQSVLTKTEISQRGGALHKEIIHTYADLRARNAIQADNDVTPMILKYIPIGTTFDDAEAILRVAQCVVGTRYGPVSSSAVSLEEQIRRRSVMARMGLDLAEVLVVMLFPRAPNDYSAIDRVEASIVSQNL